MLCVSSQNTAASMPVPKSPGLDVVPMKWRAATLTPAQPEVAREALHGLLASPKTLPSKLLYDEEGCRLFGDITRLPEY